MSKTMSIAKQLRDFVNKGEPVKLPVSGVTVYFKQVNLADLVARGIIPATLLAEALSGFPELEKAGSPEADMQKLTKAMMDARQFELAIISSGLVSPRLVDNPAEDADEISYDMLVEGDRQALLGIAQKPINTWSTFLQRERERIPLVDDIEISESTSE